MEWPTRLSSGLISRNEGWPGQQGYDSFIWGDDQYMGIALVGTACLWVFCL